MSHGTESRPNGPLQQLEVFYDGACPLCRREIGFYRKRADAEAVNWIDISDPAVGDPAPGLSRCEALARFHVRAPNGRLLSGAAAFAQLWRFTPGFRLLGRMASWPPITWVLERAYRAFLHIRPAIQGWVARRVS